MSKRIVFEEIKARLQDGQAVLGDNTWKVPGTIKLWNNQLSNIEREKSFRKPAVFIEFQDITYVGRSRRVKEGSGLLKLYILQKEMADENLDVLDYVDKIARVLEGYQTDVITSSLSKSGETQDTDHDNLIVWEQDYPLGFKDNSLSTMKGSLVIDPGKVKPNIESSLVMENDSIRTGSIAPPEPPPFDPPSVAEDDVAEPDVFE